MDRWRRAREKRRVQPGNGQPLQRFRWWQLFSRSLFTLALPGDPSEYAIEVRQAGDRDDGEVRARLYQDGLQHAVSRLPARFAVPGGEIEVAVGSFGMKRCHYVTADGERQLVPHPHTAEGRRARLHQEHPTLSRLIGVVSTVMVVVGLSVTLPQLVATISEIPPIADSIGTFDFPLELPLELTIAIGVATVLGSVERALRFRSTWLDDLAN